MTLKLTILAIDTSWLLLLGAPDGATSSARVSPAEVLCLLNEVKALKELNVGAVTNHEREHQLADAAERRFGQVLASFFPEELWTMLRDFVIDRRPHGGAVLTIEAHSVAAREVPWELLAEGKDSDALCYLDRGDLSIVRLHASNERPKTPVGARLGVVIYTPDPHDAVVKETRGVLEAGLTAASFDLCDLTEPVGAGRGVEELICIFAHGVIVQNGQLLVQTSRQDASVEALPAALGERMKHALAVVLLVCSGGAATPMDNLAAYLIRVGAPAVFAAQAPLSAAHARNFVTGLAPQLRQGVTLQAALVKAREEVAKLHDASLSDRRWLMSLCVGRIDAPSRHLCAVALPELVLSFGPTLQALFVKAGELLRGDPALRGFVGVEVLLLAMATQAQDHTDRELRKIAEIGQEHGDELRSRLKGLEWSATAWSAPSGAPPPLSPRLHRTLLGLKPDAMLLDLWRALLKERFFVLSAMASLGGSDHGKTYAPSQQSRPCARRTNPDERPQVLEVVGGPEDGLLIRWPEVSTPIVRHNARVPEQNSYPAVRLYGSSVVFDPTLSRGDFSGGLESTGARIPLFLEPGGRLRWTGKHTGPTHVYHGSVERIADFTWIGCW